MPRHYRRPRLEQKRGIRKEATPSRRSRTLISRFSSEVPFVRPAKQAEVALVRGLFAPAGEGAIDTAANCPSVNYLAENR